MYICMYVVRFMTGARLKNPNLLYFLQHVILHIHS